MATQAEIEDLLTAVANANAATSQLDTEREVLAGYKAERQRFASLVDAQKELLDQLVLDAEATLRVLATKINTVFPVEG